MIDTELVRARIDVLRLAAHVHEVGLSGEAGPSAADGADIVATAKAFAAFAEAPE